MRGIVVVSAAALICLTGASGTAEAQPANKYAPSAMVLTFAQGDSIEDTVLRAATLSCTPTPQGTHRDPKAACAALNSTGGSFDRLLAAPQARRMCPMIYDPVTIAAVGVWQGSRVAWTHTFSNACVMSTAVSSSPVFAF
ncbi:subtilase-type protease inhibitor [Streptomyces sp. NBC_00096]|uniref:subtilase-type protease inhibitor n=1 Tax=Streptomyces sp. NBC_00096 TaxID=2975650 RepID=UPI00324A3E0C